MKYTRQRKSVWIILILMLLMSAAYFFIESSAKVKPSADPLSMGITERWGAALPDGFEKESAENIQEGKGYNFAKLVFAEDISEVLARWEPVDQQMQDQMNGIIDGQLNDPATTAEQTALIERCRPQLDGSWIGFSLVNEKNPNAVLALVYNAETRVMVVVEQQK